MTTGRINQVAAFKAKQGRLHDRQSPASPLVITVRLPTRRSALGRFTTKGRRNIAWVSTARKRPRTPRQTVGAFPRTTPRMRRWDPTLGSGYRLEKRPTSLRPPDKPLRPQRLRAYRGRKSPDAVWQYGCATKSAEPVSIQAPQHRAARFQRKRGPSKAVETALSLV